MTTFNAETVTTLSDAIHNAAKGCSPLAKLFRTEGAKVYGDEAGQKELAVILAEVKEQVVTKRDAFVKYLGRNERESEIGDFVKSSKDQVTYAVKVAGLAAGCKFKYVKKTDSYMVEQLAIKGESDKLPANGKDENSAEQSADIVAAAIAEPVISAAERATSANGFFHSFLKAGGSVAELEKAFHDFTAELAAKAASEELAANNGAGEPKAPAIAAERIAADLSKATNGVKVKTSRRAAKKAA